MKKGAVVQARTTSVRLPGKVLKELPYGSGITVLEQVIRRLKRSGRLDEIIIATTTNKGDDEIVKIAKKEGVKHSRGSEEDVLSRYYHAARENSLGTVVRITGDCPCMDADVVDFIISRHLDGKMDYTSSALKRTYPHGLDVEVFGFGVLEQAFNEAKEDFEREHVTPYMFRSGKFKTLNVEAPDELNFPDIRVTLDTREDYALLCAVYDFLYPGTPFFGAKEIVGLFKKKPWLKYINGEVAQKKIYDSLTDELEEAVRVLDMQGLTGARDIIKGRLARGL